jgi:uncharacterized protein YhbP (UPF0306 family)
MTLDHVRCALRTIHEIQYVTMATVCPGGEAIPWNTPVYTAFDSAYNFFWVSDRESQHSTNIRANPHVFLAMYDSTIPEGTGARKGVYIQAKARELVDREEIIRAHKLVAGRSGKAPRSADCYSGDMPGRLYVAMPERLWVNDTLKRNGIRVDGRVEVDLAAIRAASGFGESQNRATTSILSN